MTDEELLVLDIAEAFAKLDASTAFNKTRVLIRYHYEMVALKSYDAALRELGMAIRLAMKEQRDVFNRGLDVKKN